MTYVLITGAKGFIGQNLARHLFISGRRVVGLGHGAIPPTQLPRYGLTEWLNGDVDHANLLWIIRRYGAPEDIFHLAGGSNVGRSMDNPLEDFSRTVVTAGHLFEWVRSECKSARTTVVSSAAVYGEGHFGPIKESVSLRPFSPYGAHKAMMEQLAKSYSENFGLNIAICRLFSVYGAGLEKQLVYDLCIKCLAATKRHDESLELFGTGDEVRDWIHIDDVCSLLALVSTQASGACPVFNGGTGLGVPVKTIARLVSQSFGAAFDLRFNGRRRVGDPTSLIADTSSINSLGFRVRERIDAGIRNLVNQFLAAENSE